MDRTMPLREAIQRVRIAESTSAYWDGLNGTREAADQAHELALTLVDDLACQLGQAQDAIRRAARRLRDLSSVYTLGPGNERRVIDLLWTDTAKAADELELSLRLA
ncbi:MAG TPA: hypothetical protein VFU98_03425 [Microlunatus sp.]|nr:hypothetical protein [Microlunatus sp.]